MTFLELELLLLIAALVMIFKHESGADSSLSVETRQTWGKAILVITLICLAFVTPIRKIKCNIDSCQSYLKYGYLSVQHKDSEFKKSDIIECKHRHSYSRRGRAHHYVDIKTNKQTYSKAVFSGNMANNICKEITSNRSYTLNNCEW